MTVVNAPPKAMHDLISRISRGDRAAYRQLYDEMAPKLFAITLRICRDRAVAEDATQDAFVEIWRKAKDFDGAKGAPGAWMNVIARNKAIDVVRRRGRAVMITSGEDGMDVLDYMPDLKSPQDGGVDSMALGQCLGRLEAREKDLVVLAYCEGLSREELSERYDAPVNTIKTWLRRGLAALKSCLDGDPAADAKQGHP